MLTGCLLLIYSYVPLPVDAAEFFQDNANNCPGDAKHKSSCNTAARNSVPKCHQRAFEAYTSGSVHDRE